MFCKKCGNKLSPDSRFCDGCGTSVGDESQSPASPTWTNTSIIAKTFRCSGCDASLNIPKNPRGQVKCPYCNTECVLDGIVKNAEMAAKENINSGLPLTALPARLHKHICDTLYKNKYIPLDVFDNLEIVREEHFCVPAFFVEYGGDAPFSYQEGHQETSQVRGFDGGRETITTIKEVKWHTERGSASVSGTLCVSGNKEMTELIEKFYFSIDHNQLVDFEYLDFPSDVKTLNYDQPQLTAFNEYAKPLIEKQLDKEGKKTLQGTEYEGRIPRGGERGVVYTSDFKMGGAKIQKEITRVFMGLYRLVYKYGGEEYEMWASANGEKIIYDNIPIDKQRQDTYTKKEAALSESNSLKKKGFGWYIAGLVVSIFGAFFIGENLVVGIIAILLAILFIWLMFAQKDKIKQHNERVAKAQMDAKQDSEAFDGQRISAIQQFKSQKKALRGIYEKVSGDESAF
jgi:uncharacterized Zn-finger protein